MIGRRRTRFAALAAAGLLVLAACGGDDDSDTEGTQAPAGTEAPAATEAPAGTEVPAGTEAPSGTEAPAEGEAWAVDTSECIDEEAANAPIEGTLKIGSVMPLSGGVAAIAFAPVKSGMETYIKYANENNLVPGVTLELSVADDQYNKDLTPGEVDKLLDAGVHIFSGIIGSPNNAAVRDTLNEECVPQLMALTGSPAWGEVADYPWTTGALVPYPVEAKVYAAQLQEQFPDGATVALFTVNNEFGQIYVEAFKEVAGEYGIEIVEEQTIEATDEAPPTAQVNEIAAQAPDAIMAVPLGAQCPTFLSEVAKAKAANSGWDPQIYLTNTCSSALILGAAGDAANGIYTSSNLKDVNDPEVQQDPKVAEYIEYMTANGYGDIVTTGAAGWGTAEVTVAILAQAAASPEGLTRASIINAARNFEYVGSLARDGVVARMNGEADPFLNESLQVIQYDAATKTFTDIGELITDFES
jgi:ABC-type branched-subunit amino acid transport system substrate-binding protein